MLNSWRFKSQRGTLIAFEVVLQSFEHPRAHPNANTISGLRAEKSYFFRKFHLQRKLTPIRYKFTYDSYNKTQKPSIKLMKQNKNPGNTRCADLVLTIMMTLFSSFVLASSLRQWLLRDFRNLCVLSFFWAIPPCYLLSVVLRHVISFGCLEVYVSKGELCVRALIFPASPTNTQTTDNDR